jgi:hypothetical protein
VVYDPEQQKQILSKVFGYLSYWLWESLRPGYSMYAREAFLDAGKDCLAYLTRLMKHPGFAEEKEWRIIYDGLADLSAFGIDQKRQKRARGEEQIDYHVWKFPPSFVSKITLGPKCAVAMDDVKTKLVDWGYENVTVEQSDIPYQ